MKQNMSKHAVTTQQWVGKVVKWRKMAVITKTTYGQNVWLLLCSLHQLVFPRIDNKSSDCDVENFDASLFLIYIGTILKRKVYQK